MLDKVKNIIIKTDLFLFKKFGSDKSVKLLENIKEAKIIFTHLNETGKENVARFVGGCVRKSLTGEIIDDVDLAITLEPNEVKKKLLERNIKVIDTGISHGTLTVIINNKKFELTTLRKDISTDGRHAEVQFTSHWEEDAARRDFTINAIYVDPEGRIFDPYNGVIDLKNGEIKFIGDAKDRIQEDYLRILRYLRFFTQYSKTDHDLNTIKSIKQNINGLNKISNERIFDELKKFLSLKNFSDLFFNNESKEIFLNIFPQIKYYSRLKNLNNLNKKIKEKYDKYLILALLIIDESNNYEYFCHKYKTSNNIKNRFKNISANYNNLRNKKFYSESNLKKLIYFTNKDHVRDLLLFAACDDNKIKNLDIEKLINYTNNCKIPEFPITGEYLKKYGYKSGKILGEKLKSLEEKWIENNFIMEKTFLEKSLGKLNKT